MPSAHVGQAGGRILEAIHDRVVHLEDDPALVPLSLGQPAEIPQLLDRQEPLTLVEGLARARGEPNGTRTSRSIAGSSWRSHSPAQCAATTADTSLGGENSGHQAASSW